MKKITRSREVYLARKAQEKQPRIKSLVLGTSGADGEFFSGHNWCTTPQWQYQAINFSQQPNWLSTKRELHSDECPLEFDWGIRHSNGAYIFMHERHCGNSTEAYAVIVHPSEDTKAISEAAEWFAKQFPAPGVSHSPRSIYDLA